MLRNLFLGTWSCFYRAAVLSNTGVTSQVWLYKTELLLLLFSHSVMSDSATPWTAARQASLSFTISWRLLKLMSVESEMPSNYLILCHPLLLPPSVFPSIRVFPNELALCIRWPKYWSFSFRINPSNEFSGLISFILLHSSCMTDLYIPPFPQTAV